MRALYFYFLEYLRNRLVACCNATLMHPFTEFVIFVTRVSLIVSCNCKYGSRIFTTSSISGIIFRKAAKKFLEKTATLLNPAYRWLLTFGEWYYYILNSQFNLGYFCWIRTQQPKLMPVDPFYGQLKRLGHAAWADSGLRNKCFFFLFSGNHKTSTSTSASRQKCRKNITEKKFRASKSGLPRQPPDVRQVAGMRTAATW